VLVDTGNLAALLPKVQALGLTPQPGVPRGLHPIIVEIWRVNDGRMEMAGLDAHDWSELVGATAGVGMGGGAGALIGGSLGALAGAAGGGMSGQARGPLAWWWGAAAGAAAGTASGASSAASVGAMFGARLVAGVARGLSQAGSRVAGSYNEVMVTVPCTRPRSTDPSACAFVLGMYTDSALSRWGERLLGFGYRKRAARVIRQHSASIEVTTGRSDALLNVRVATAPRPSATTASHRLARHVLAALAQPLLGLAPSGRTAVSFLQRSFRDASVRLQPVAVQLEASGRFLPGLDAMNVQIDALTPRRPWGAFLATGLPLVLTYPRVEE
jgi:hypothetical protein